MVFFLFFFFLLLRGFPDGILRLVLVGVVVVVVLRRGSRWSYSSTSGLSLSLCLDLTCPEAGLYAGT